MSRLLLGRVALVTGGGSGIGRATALAFAKEGARVVVACRTVEKGEDTIRLIREAGREGVFVKGDVSKADEVASLVAKTVETYGQLDCAFNNAGILGDKAPTEQCTEGNWNRVIDTNLKGVWLCMKYEIRQMLKQGRGVIVNTSSLSGLAGHGHGLPAYIASKHGVLGLTKAAALEYARKGIRVNAVCPSPTLTPMIENIFRADPALAEYASSVQPMGRLATPDEIAAAVIWLCSDAASFVTGHAMAVDGGRFASE